MTIRVRKSFGMIFMTKRWGWGVAQALLSGAFTGGLSGGLGSLLAQRQKILRALDGFMNPLQELLQIGVALNKINL
jgi:hypothetical protein